MTYSEEVKDIFGEAKELLAKQDKGDLVADATVYICVQCVSFVVARSIKANVPTNNKLEQVQVMIGALVISRMVGKKAKFFVRQEIERTRKQWRQAKAVSESRRFAKNGGIDE